MIVRRINVPCEQTWETRCRRCYELYSKVLTLVAIGDINYDNAHMVISGLRSCFTLPTTPTLSPDIFNVPRLVTLQTRQLLISFQRTATLTPTFMLFYAENDTFITFSVTSITK